MNGAFNINSTSVAAWKAMLASIHDSQAIYQQTQQDRQVLSLQRPRRSSHRLQARISRFRLPRPRAMRDPDENYWLEPANTRCANCRSSPKKSSSRSACAARSSRWRSSSTAAWAPDETAQRGALQQAIDDSDLNKSFAGSQRRLRNPRRQVAGYNIQKRHRRHRLQLSGRSGLPHPGGPAQRARQRRHPALRHLHHPRLRRGPRRQQQDHSCLRHLRGHHPTRSRNTSIPPTSRKSNPRLLTSTTNKIFGRRFNLISFRWLAASEV